MRCPGNATDAHLPDHQRTRRRLPLATASILCYAVSDTDNE